MRRVSMAGLIGGALFLLIASVAAAQPDNKNVVTFDVDCDGLGSFTVSSVGGGNVVFGPNGETIVAKRVDATFDADLAISGGPTIPLSFSFMVGAQGQGFEDRLVECTFEQFITETLTIKNREIRQFGLDPALKGAEATLTGSVSGTAWVFVKD
jgi:hypothetical protein